MIVSVFFAANIPLVSMRNRRFFKEDYATPHADPGMRFDDKSRSDRHEERWIGRSADCKNGNKAGGHLL